MGLRLRTFAFRLSQLFFCFFLVGHRVLGHTFIVGKDGKLIAIGNILTQSFKTYILEGFDGKWGYF